MSGRNGKSRRTEQGRQPRSGHDVPQEKRRRQRLPVHARLTLDDSLPPNEHHPLAPSSPDVRAASRVRLIAGILARMAQASVGPLD